MVKNEKKLNIICIIPARGGSKGIPRKNLISFCGKPLIQWSIEQALGSKLIKRVYVSSDSEEILKLSNRLKANTIKRPKRIAGDTSSTEDALVHAIDYLECEKKEKVDIVVLLQATSPIRTSLDIDNAISQFITDKADSLFSAAILEDFCVWGYRNSKLKSITYDYKRRGIRQQRKPYYLENGSIYIFKPMILRKYRNRLGGKIVIYFMPLCKSFEIDTGEDLKICSYFMRENIALRNNTYS